MTIRERISGLEPRQIILPLILLLIFIGTVFGIINYQRRVKEQATPTIQVTRPEEGTSTKDAQIVVEGKTSSGATVRVNEKDAGMDAEGNFAAEVPLEAGENNITIVSTGTNGKTSIITRKIVREVAVEPNAGPNQTVNEEKLSSSGPEEWWLLGSGTLSSAAAAWYYSRKKLGQALNK